MYPNCLHLRSLGKVCHRRIHIQPTQLPRRLKSIKLATSLCQKHVRYASSLDFRDKISETSEMMGTYKQDEKEDVIGSDYFSMVEAAKQQARRSIIISNNTRDYSFLDNFDNKEEVYNVDIYNESRRVSSLTVIEFKSASDVMDVCDSIKLPSNFLSTSTNILVYQGRQKYRYKSSHNIVNVDLKTKSVKDIKCFKDLIPKRSDFLMNVRLKMITLNYIEDILCSGPYKEYCLLPFGSSMFVYGTGGDLDLVFTRKDWKVAKRKVPFIRDLHTLPLDGEKKPFICQFANFLKERVPIVSSKSILSIPNAKVPIIKFKTNYTMIDCDLSFDNEENLLLKNPTISLCHTGLKMNQIIYDLCTHNTIFKMSLMYLREFATEHGIYSKIQGGFTNFQLMSLIIFYLQKLILRSIDLDYMLVNETDKCVLPPLRRWFEEKPYNYASEKIIVSDEEIERVMPMIIKGFCQFYIKFPYQSNKIDIFNAKSVPKISSHYRIHVSNPFVPNRNICSTIGQKALNHFVETLKLALKAEPLDLLNDSKKNNQIDDICELD